MMVRMQGSSSISVLPYRRTLHARNGERRDDRRVVEREHHYRIASHRVIHRPFPVADAVSRDAFPVLRRSTAGSGTEPAASVANKREYQNTHRFNDHLLTEGTMVIIPTIRISDRIARGGGSYPAGET